MPIATTADLILAGIMDIQQALQQAPAGLNIPPSHVAALQQLIEVLTSSTLSKDEAAVTPPQQPLRVESKQLEEPGNPPAQRVKEDKVTQGIIKTPSR